MPITVSGTNIVFNDATTQTTAFTSAVTSLNGQTGAVVTTTNNNIGASQVVAHVSTSVGYITGTTLAGSSLYSPTSLVGYWTGNPTYPILDGNVSGNKPSTILFRSDNRINQNTNGNVGIQTPRGCTTLSGTWRCMDSMDRASSSYDSKNNNTSQAYPLAMWVRVS